MTLYTGTALPVLTEENWFFTGSPAATSFTETGHTFDGWAALGDPVYLFITLNSATISVNSITSATHGGAWTLLGRRVQGTISQEFWVNTTMTAGNASGNVVIALSGSTIIDVAQRVFNGVDTAAPLITSAQGGSSSTVISMSAGVAESNSVVVFVGRLKPTGATLNASIVQRPASLKGDLLNNRGVAITPATGTSGFGWVEARTPVLNDPVYSSGKPAVSDRFAGTLSVAVDFVYTVIVVRGARVDMDDYSYRYKDTGVKLNNQTGTPVYDVDKVSGLTDITIDADSGDYDGADGGYTFAKFLSQKTIIFDGSLYSSPLVESVVDTLRGNFIPQSTDQPLHFVHPGNGRRVIYCKPIGFKSDIDQARARGQVIFQVQLQASDPRMYDDAKSVQLLPGANSLTLVGNKPTPPVIWFSVQGPDITAGGSFTFTKAAVDGDRTITVDIEYDAFESLTVDSYQLDFSSRTLTRRDGTDMTKYITTRDWWQLDPGVNTITTARPSTADEATVYYSEAWI